MNRLPPITVRIHMAWWWPIYWRAVIWPAILWEYTGLGVPDELADKLAEHVVKMAKRAARVT